MTLTRRIVVAFLRKSGNTQNLVTVTNAEGYAFLDADDLDRLFRDLKQSGIRSQSKHDRLTVNFGHSLDYEGLLDTLEDLGYVVDA